MAYMHYISNNNSSSSTSDGGGGVNDNNNGEQKDGISRAAQCTRVLEVVGEKNNSNTLH